MKIVNFFFLVYGLVISSLEIGDVDEYLYFDVFFVFFRVFFVCDGKDDICKGDFFFEWVRKMLIMIIKLLGENRSKC